MEEFQAALPESVRFPLQLLIDAAGVGVFAYIAWRGSRPTLNNLSTRRDAGNAVLAVHGAAPPSG